MGLPRTRTIGIRMRLGIVAALTTSLFALMPLDARADDLPPLPTVKVTSGGGVVHGIAEFHEDPLGNTGLPSTCTEDGPGDHVRFTFDGYAPDFAYNTVITGFVGVVRLTGWGYSECATGPTRTGSIEEMRITGTGPTGSEIDCGILTGGFNRAATAVAVEVSGPCTINRWATSDVNFVSALQFTPFDPVGSGVSVSPVVNAPPIERAYFDGPFILVPVIT